MSSYRLGKTISMWNMLKQPPSTLSSTLSFYYIIFFKILLCERVVALISLNYLPEAWPSDPVSNQSIGKSPWSSNAPMRCCQRMPGCASCPPFQTREWIGRDQLVGGLMIPSIFFDWLVGGLFPFNLGFTWHDLKVDLHYISLHDMIYSHPWASGTPKPQNLKSCFDLGQVLLDKTVSLIFLFSMPLPCSAFHLSILSEVWLLNFLRWF